MLCHPISPPEVCRGLDPDERLPLVKAILLKRTLTLSILAQIYPPRPCCARLGPNTTCTPPATGAGAAKAAATETKPAYAG